VNSVIFLCFWKISRNRLAGCSSPPGGACNFCLVLGYWSETAWRHIPGRQATYVFYTILGFLDELPGGDEFPPGDAGLRFGFCHSRVLW